MKILIIENEYNEIRGAFEYVNFKYLKNELEIVQIDRTQDCDVFLNILNEFDFIFVDIALSSKSKKDGYSFIHSIKEYYELKKVVIITGSDNVQQKVQEYELNSVKILKKPITFIEVKNILLP